MAGFAIAGLIIGAIGTAVGIGMQVDATNKAAKRQRRLEARQKDMNKKAGIRKVLETIAAMATGNTITRVSNSLSDKRIDKLRVKTRMKAKRPGASQDYRIAAKAHNAVSSNYMTEGQQSYPLGRPSGRTIK